MATLMFYMLCVFGLSALLGLILMLFSGRDNDRGLVLGVILSVVGMLSLIVPVVYDQSFSMCPCKVAVIGFDGKATTELHNVKAIFQGRHGYVTFWFGGLNWETYSMSQVRYSHE